MLDPDSFFWMPVQFRVLYLQALAKILIPIFLAKKILRNKHDGQLKFNKKHLLHCFLFLHSFPWWVQCNFWKLETIVPALYSILLHQYDCFVYCFDWFALSVEIQGPIFALNPKTNFGYRILITFSIYFQCLFDEMFTRDSIQNIQRLMFKISTYQHICLLNLIL